MKKVIGIDIGNAKTELFFETKDGEKSVRQPSVISYLLKSPDAPDLTENQVVSSLLDNLMVTISSKAIKKNGLYYVGNKALQHAGIKTNMNLDLGGKNDHDVPLITSLSMVAASAIKEHYEQHKELPENMNIELKMVTAIPSSEFSSKKGEHLEDRFKERHTVIVHVGNEEILTSIKVSECKVTEEGKTAMLAFYESDPSILHHYNDLYKENKVPSDFDEATSLHTDIGDGTTEFTVIKGLSPLPGLSNGKHFGVGHASMDAISLLRETSMNIPNDFTRQQLQEWLKQDSERGQLVRSFMKQATYNQSTLILEEIQTAYQKLASSNVDYLFVHGGGSITFEDPLKNELVNFARDNYTKVVWIPKEYATQMNSRGTYSLAKMLYEKK